MPKQLNEVQRVKPANANRRLVEAVGHGDLRAVCRCLDAGADPSARDKNGVPLILSSFDWSIVSELIKAGADIFVKDKNGSTVLHRAAADDESDVVDLALTHGLDVEVRDDFDETALASAVRSGALDTVCELIGWRADVNAMNFEGRTPRGLIDYSLAAAYHIDF